MRLYMILMFFILLLMSIWDIKCQKIPRGLILSGFLVSGIRMIFLFMSEGPLAERLFLTCKALLGALPGLIMVVLSYYTDKIGRGDGMVITITGLCEDFLFSMILVCMACIFMALPGAVMLFCGKIGKNTRFPFVPFVMASFIILKLLSIAKMGGIV